MELSHVRRGDGPPLVVLHGLMGSARNWAGIARRLADGYAVHVLDARNHGDSPRAATMTYAEMAADIRDFIAARGLDRPVVLGHSMGGKTAMTLALGHGAAIGGLIVADIAPVAYTVGFMGHVEAMRALDLAAIARRADADAALADAVSEPGVRAFLLHNLVSRDGGYGWQVDLEAVAANAEALAGFAAAAGTYDGPTLLLRGSASGYVRPEHEDAIRRLFPRAAIETMEGAGHWLHAERPDDFAGRVRDFLKAG